MFVIDKFGLEFLSVLQEKYDVGTASRMNRMLSSFSCSSNISVILLRIVICATVLLPFFSLLLAQPLTVATSTAIDHGHDCGHRRSPDTYR